MKKVIIITLIALLVGIICLFIHLNCIKKTNEIILKTNSGVPYVWEYEIADESIVKYKDTKTVNKSSGNITGGPVELHYIFTGLKEGKTTITFKYKHIAENDVAETKKYKATVDKNLKLKIEDQN